jgi:hypothetical protein
MRHALLLFPLLLVAAAACSNATDEVVGGEPLPVIASMAQCSATGPACFTWTYLYNCYFGPTGAASCSAQSECHASSGSLGAQVGYNFVCGSTADTCWHGMTGSSPPIVPKGATNPTKTLFYSAIHKSSVANVTSMSNNMPLMNYANPTQPAYTFTPSDLACIEGWITAGAQED